MLKYVYALGIKTVAMLLGMFNQNAKTGMYESENFNNRQKNNL